MQQLKAAMARIVINIIQADGIIDDREVECLEHLKEEFKINNKDLLETRAIPFGCALNVLRDNYQKFKKLIDNFINSIDNLAKTDNVVSANEAMLLLSINYVIKKGCTALSYHGNIKFSKREVLFLDNDSKENYEDQLKKGLYDTVKNSFLGYGFHFIFIPNVIDSLFSKPTDVIKQIVTYLYPYIEQNSAQLKIITDRLNQMTTCEYCNIIADILGCPTSEFSKSILFKVTTSDIYDKDRQTFVSYDDFVVFKLEDGIALSLSKLLKEYINLVGVMNTNTTIFPDDYFHYHGFHKTLFDSIVNIQETKLTIDITTNSRKRIDFGNGRAISMGDKYLCIYMTIIYMSKKSGGRKDSDTYEIFKKLYKFLTLSSKVCSKELFKEKLTHDVREIREAYIGKIPDLDDQRMFMPLCKKENGESVFCVHQNAFAHTFVKHNNNNLEENILTFFERHIVKKH